MSFFSGLILTQTGLHRSQATFVHVTFVFDLKWRHPVASPWVVVTSIRILASVREASVASRTNITRQDRHKIHPPGSKLTTSHPRKISKQCSVLKSGFKTLLQCLWTEDSAFTAMGVLRIRAGATSACCSLLLTFAHAIAAGKLNAEEPDRNMELHFLGNMSVTCNDGSPAG